MAQCSAAFKQAETGDTLIVCGPCKPSTWELPQIAIYQQDLKICNDDRETDDEVSFTPCGMDRYGRVPLEYIEKRGEITFYHGIKWYHWDPMTGDIMDAGYWLTIEDFMKIVRTLSKNHRIPKILMGKIYKSLRQKLPSATRRDQQIDIFTKVMSEVLPWIASDEITPLARALN
jgi:hypothetical protein